MTVFNIFYMYVLCCHWRNKRCMHVCTIMLSAY